MPSTITPNMSLIQPTIGVESGPTWALDINSSLSTVDSHDHSSGRGVAISVAGLSIQADLSINSNNITSLRSTRYSALSLASLTASDVGSLFFSGVDLYARDVNGNTIRLTQSGGIVGTSGSISSLASPASASYIAGSQTFIWQSGVSISANMDMGAIILRNTTASSNGITIAPPAGLGASYTLTLPTAVPGTNNALTLTSTAGTQSFLSQGSANQVLAVNNAGTALAYGLVVTANITDAAVTRAKLAAVGQVLSASSGAHSQSNGLGTYDVTNLSISITTTGRPVQVCLVPDGTANSAALAWSAGSGESMDYFIFVTDTSNTILAQFHVSGYQAATTGVYTAYPPGGIAALFSPAAGTQTYKIRISASYKSANSYMQVQYVKLSAFEL